MNELRFDLQQSYNKIEFSENTDFGTIYKSYEKLSQSVLDKHAPISTRRIIPKRGAPWMDGEFRKSRSQRRRLERVWRRTRSNEDKLKYIEQRKSCADMAVVKQNEYYTNLVRKSPNDQKALFKIANELLDKNKERILPSYTDAKQLADDFNKY